MKNWILIMAFCLLLIGCKQTELTVDDEGGKITIETSDEDATITIESAEPGTEEEGPWCVPGADWQLTAETGEGVAEASWKVVEVVSSGEFAGLCHVLYTSVDEDGEKLEVDYYFNEDGNVVRMQARIDGQQVVVHQGMY